MSSPTADPVHSDAAAPRSRWLAAGVPAAWVVCGAGLLSTSMTRWFRRGPGSQFAGLELADSIRSGVFSPSWGVWVAAGAYALVGLGGGFIATAVVTHRALLLVRGGVATVCLVGFVLLGCVVPPSNWSSGPTIATFVFALAVALSTVQLVNTVRN